MDEVAGLYQFKQNKLSLDAGYAHNVLWVTDECVGRLNTTKFNHSINTKNVRKLWHKIGPKELVTWG